jgi:hypothetical protein
MSEATTYICNQNFSEISNLNIDYAHKKRLFKRFTLEQKLFMLEIFFKGERNSSHKISHTQAEKLMKTKFSIDFRLKAIQIKSYFTYLAKDKTKAELLCGVA